MQRTRTMVNRRTFARYVVTLGAGAAAGAMASGRIHLNPSVRAESTTVADPTATREAELEELHSLQTQVAEPRICTPASTSTPVPPTATATQVPPASVGIPLAYMNTWTITVQGIVMVPGTDQVRAKGKFMQLAMTLSHSERSTKLVPYLDFVLVDSAGRFSTVDQGINQALFGNNWLFGIGPGEVQDRSFVFDVAADAGDSFILESKADPTFRVAMTVEQRG